MSNPSFKTCSAGHYYASSLTDCPYCSEGNSKTVTNFNNSSDLDKTQIIQPSGKQEPKSQVGNNKNNANQVDNSTFFSPTDDDRTLIRVPNREGVISNDNSVRQTRKLTGWLVSFTIDTMGIDFRLFEGQNKVGRESSCTVRIIQDGLISAHHATILFRNNMFYLRDEMTTNSSFINGVELLPGATMEIKDGDKLKFGNNDFLLRVAF